MEITKEMLKQGIEKAVKFIERTGLTVVDIKTNYVKLLMPLKENENHIGVMYAGAHFMLADVAGGAIAYSTFDISKY
jgi:acyl-coenzyme A thioesterase PaaI-like protein